jgi:protein involved in polysaccharide export with SLBB domain
MLKKYLTYSLITYLLFCNIFSQVSTRDINRLSNSQLDALKAAIEPKSEIDNFISSELEEIIEPPTNNEIVIEAENSDEESPYFGYSYFKNDINFFDNTPTPSDFRLGPGDEIILSMWGETNLRKSFTINKDGMIYYRNIGFINLSNKNLKESELLLVEELSRIYSTLKNEDNPTKLMLELGQLKSINVYFSGHIENPGINLVHPFSDIFSAIIQAGGIGDKGSLREVQLIRDGKIINKVDFYAFFMNGTNNFSNIKLIDGDVIHIPNVKNRVSIFGEVNRPFIYELLPNESVSDIVGYASGFTSNASSSIILSQIVPLEKRSSDDNAKTSVAINYRNEKSTLLNDGDTVEVLTITDVDSYVDIYGRVKSPGKYPANTSLKNILNLAGGFDDPIFRKTIRENEIFVLRKDSNQFYSEEILTDYESAEKLQLLPNDKIFVYEDINYRNSLTYRIEGEVNKPGTYPLIDGITVGKAIEIAQGFTILGNENSIIVKQEFTELNIDDEEITSTINVANTDLNFKLGGNSIISVLPFENVVRVEGNVYSPGLVAYERNLSAFDAIVQAGGFMPNSMKNRVYIRKANGEIEKPSLLFRRVKRLSAGDTVVVPVNPSPSDFDITNFVADLSTTLANIAAILLVIDNQQN